MEIKPRAPLSSECCGLGCKSCVLDLYQKELDILTNAVESVTVTEQTLQPMCPNLYVRCELIKIEQQNSVCSVYTFRLPVGFYLQSKWTNHLVAREEGNGELVTRCYTMLNPPGNRNEFSVLVKLYSNGMMSRIISRRWTVGCTVEWRGPLGNLVYRPNSYKKLVLLAAGTGIVPVYQVAKMITENEEDETLIKLVFCCKTYSTIPLREEVRKLQEFWNFTSVIYLSEDVREAVEATKRYNENVICGKLSQDDLSKEMKSFSAKSNDTLIMICGTKCFEKQFKEHFANLGFESSSVVTF